MSTATLTRPTTHRADELEARVRAFLTLEEIAVPDLLPILRQGREAAELELAELLEDVR